MFGNTQLVENLLQQLSEERTRNAQLVETLTRMQREGFVPVAAPITSEPVTIDPSILAAVQLIPEGARESALRWALQHRHEDPAALVSHILNGE